MNDYSRRVFRFACMAAVPRSKRFHALLIYCRFLAWLETWVRPPKKRRGVARRLEVCLVHFREIEPVFVPIQLTGLDRVREAHDEGRGVLLCHLHLPFFSVVINGLNQAGFALDYFFADPINITEGEYICLLTGDRCPAIE